jgi:outer membrane protein assembly factor BamB
MHTISIILLAVKIIRQGQVLNLPPNEKGRMTMNPKMFLLLFCVLSLILMMPSVSYASDWTQFQKDSFNSGLTYDRAPVTAPSSISWTYKTASGSGGMGYSGAVNVVPVVAGDILYVVVPGGNVSAIDKTTGSVIWTTSIGAVSFQIGSPAYGNNTLFVPREDGKMYALDGQSGDILWETGAIGDWMYTPVVYDEHRIYFGDCSDYLGNNGRMFCYSDTGEEIWSRASSSGGGYYWAGPAVVGDFVVFVDSRGNLTSLYKDAGSVCDEISVTSMFAIGSPGEFKSSVSYSPDSGKVFFTSGGGYCYSVGFNADGTFDVSDVHYRKLYASSTSTPAVFNGRVYVGCGGFSEGRLYCLDEGNLSEIWYYTANGGIKASPALSRAYDDGDGEVYVYFTTNCASGAVYCLKDYPGNTAASLQWRYDPPAGMSEYILQGVSISDGWVFFGNDAGYLFGLANSQSIIKQYVFADFKANVTSGDSPITVQFTDMSVGATSWSWDVNGDGIEDYTVQNPVHTYEEPGVYTASLTARKSSYSHTRTGVGYIDVDWNPWNDPDSEKGNIISLNEASAAVTCWQYKLAVPNSGGHVISLVEISDIVTCWQYKIPME